jgi:hypothetical protein
MGTCHLAAGRRGDCAHVRSRGGIGTILRNGKSLKPTRIDEIAAAIRSGR